MQNAFLQYLRKLLLIAAMLTLTFPALLHAQPAQKPLLSRDGGGVSPNLMLTLDTSRSMDFQHAPEYDFKINTGASTTVTVTFPNFKYVWMHPYDPGPGYYDGSFSGIVPSNPYRPSSTKAQMVWQMQMRSPDVNTLYYNPERRYLPWINADRTRWANSPPTAAPFIPTLPMTGLNRASPAQAVGNANLTLASFSVPANTVAWGLPTNGMQTAATSGASSSEKVTWCTSFAAPNTLTCSSSAAETYYPMIYYRLKKSGGYFLDPSDYRNYSMVDINAQQAKLTMSGTASTPSSAGTWSAATSLTNAFPKSAARTDCTAVTGYCNQAEEQQNFANWFTYYRSRMLLAQGAIPEAFKDIEDDKIRLGWGRIHAASKLVDGIDTTVIDSGVRDFGGTLSSSVRGKFITWLRNHPGNTGSAGYSTEPGTELIKSVIAVGNYYKRTDNAGPWADVPGGTGSTTHKTCRRAYNMLVTDGYYGDSTTAYGNYDGDNRTRTTITSGSQTYTYSPVAPYKDSYNNTLADVALSFWADDLRGATGTALDNKVVPTAEDPAFWQHMNNYMVGLGVNGTLNQISDWSGLKDGTTPWPNPTGAGRVDDLWHAAVNSRGSYYSVKDPQELTEGIQDALGQTLKRELKEAGVATASTTLQNGNRKYVPYYKTSDWNGDVQAYALDATGQTGAKAWEATSKLPAWASRNIYTWNTNTTPAAGALFTWGTMGAANQTALGTLTTTPASTGTELADFIRGNRSKEGDGQPFRVRISPLGDFVNSNPVLVKDAVNMGYGGLTTGGSTYSAFLTTKAARTPVLFVGGNDGMLHAFKDTVGATPADDGVEVFAYIPKTVVPNLATLANKNYGTSALYHQFYVDGPLTETDAYINAPGASTPSWRNYLLGSLGFGGRAVFALDVTDSASLGASTIRWEYSSSSDGDLGYITTPIESGVLPNGDWVAIFGNGNYSTNGKAVLFVLNLQTGVAQKLVVDSAGSNGLGGVAVVRDSGGLITNVYAGDRKGNMWKFNYLATATSKFEIADTSTALFVATNTNNQVQPITHAPVLFDHPSGGKMVVFGTGVLTTVNEANNTDVQSIYGIWDKPSDLVSRPIAALNSTLNGRSSYISTRSLTAVSGAGGSTFYSITGGSAMNWGAQRGWVIELDVISGMRVIYPGQRINSALAFISAVIPVRTVVACEAATGTGVNLFIPMIDGLNPSYQIFDTNGDGSITSSDAKVSGYASNADGVDVVLRGTQTCSGGVCSTEVSIQNTTGQLKANVNENQGSVGSRAIKDRVWRRIINPPIR